MRTNCILGPLLPRTALANSRNVPAVGLLGRVGSDEAFGLFEQLGLHDGSLPARHYGLGLIVGGLPVTLEQLVRAYTVLSSDGRLGDLVWVRGQEVERPIRIFSEDTARQISMFLSDPMARLPSFPRMGWNEYPFPVAVKTGTSVQLPRRLDRGVFLSLSGGCLGGPPRLPSHESGERLPGGGQADPQHHELSPSRPARRTRRSRFPTAARDSSRTLVRPDRKTGHRRLRSGVSRVSEGGGGAGGPL